MTGYVLTIFVVALLSIVGVAGSFLIGLMLPFLLIIAIPLISVNTLVRETKNGTRARMSR